MSVLEEWVSRSRDDHPWQREALCHGMDPRVFFEPAHKALARRTCAHCPVVADCREHALDHHESGVWGNTDDDEREEIRAERRRAHLHAVPSRIEPVRPRNRPAGHLDGWLTELMGHPGQWARLFYASPSSGAALASNLRQGVRPSPPGRWQFEGAIGDGGSYLYALYEGEDDDG